MQFLTAGVATAKAGRPAAFVQYVRSERILKIWIAKNRLKKAIGISEKLALATHVSKADARSDVLPYIKLACRDRATAEGIAQELSLDEEQAQWLAS
jgi:hypothetical protein